MENFLKALILGIIEGITEFLPISSTGHLIIANKFIKFTGSFANTFDIVIQLGAILSVVIYFWKDLFPFLPSLNKEKIANSLPIWKRIIVAFIPALLIGGFLGKKIEEYLFNSIVVSAALIIGGIILIIIEKSKPKSKFEKISSLPYIICFYIGLFQCLAMVPGTSRSGATIIGAMILGTTRSVAAEFSFFLAIPTMFAATAYSLLKTGFSISMLELQILAVGFVVSFFTAWAVIAAFMSYIRNNNFIPFAYYRIFLGLFIIFWFFGLPLIRR
jgi:undecaprenyl-diphosphatase